MFAIWLKSAVDNMRKEIEFCFGSYDFRTSDFEKGYSRSCLESKDQDGNEMLRKAIENVKMVFQPEDNYDFTDIDLYIAEYITGTALSASNFEHLKSIHDHYMS